MEEALYLAKLCSKVTVVHRREKLRASKIMQERAFANSKIAFQWEQAVQDVLGDETAGVKGVRLSHVKTGEPSELRCDGVFIAIGHSPNTSLFKGQVRMDARGYILTEHGTKTSVPGVFACGDVQGHGGSPPRPSGGGCGIRCRLGAISAEESLAESNIYNPRQFW